SFSSSSSSDSRFIYDVFINFRGEDTRKSFVSHLYAALLNAGIKTYYDDELLLKGTELGAPLWETIEKSRISIVVFSKNYAESSWCLNELAKIMECRTTHGQVVIPVFYDVDPSDVRHQRGALGETLQETAKNRKLGENVLSSWMKAINEAAMLSGWNVTNCRDEAELVPQIVEDVSKKLKSRLLSITKFPVGLDTRVQQLTSIPEIHSNRIDLMDSFSSSSSSDSRFIY
ncbi:TMV resistance protein N, partial [Trifolium medium]|nr:TMV resistance protein N [Trifolium medium]